MFSDLPQSVQNQLKAYLERDQFVQAKQLYDACVNHQPSKSPSAERKSAR